MRKGRGTLGEYRCYHCRRRFRAESGQALRCCGTDCEQKHETALEALRRQLTAEGFERDAAAPNRWTKVGVAVTEEQAHFDGLEKTLARHARVAGRIRSAAPGAGGAAPRPA